MAARMYSERPIIREVLQRSERVPPWQDDLTLREWLEPVLAICDPARLLYGHDPS